MAIFLSWSGELSYKVAESLRDWLPIVIPNIIKPFLSSEDIKKGSRWPIELGIQLEKCSFGIFCLTKGNMHSPYILFEAGALSKRLKESHLIPLLINLNPSDLIEPLKQFQASIISKNDILKIILLINEIFNQGKISEYSVTINFEKWWSGLNNSIVKILNTSNDRLVLSKIQRDEFNTILCIKESCIISNVLQKYFHTLPSKQNKETILAKPLIQELKSRLEPFAESSHIRELKVIHKKVTGLLKNLSSYNNEEMANFLTDTHLEISKVFWKFHDEAGLKRGDV